MTARVGEKIILTPHTFASLSRAYWPALPAGRKEGKCRSISTI